MERAAKVLTKRPIATICEHQNAPDARMLAACLEVGCPGCGKAGHSYNDVYQVHLLRAEGGVCDRRSFDVELGAQDLKDNFTHP